MRSAGQVRLARLLSCPIPATPDEYFRRLEERRRLLTAMMAAWDATCVDVVVCDVYGLVAPPHWTAGV